VCRPQRHTACACYIEVRRVFVVQPSRLLGQAGRLHHKMFLNRY